MDDITHRLTATAAQCVSALDTWLKDKKKHESREALSEAVHELRKVASRLEIDLAISERDEMTQKPIPIPSHRDARRRKNNDETVEAADFDDAGDVQDAKPKLQRSRRRPMQNKPASDGDSSAA